MTTINDLMDPLPYYNRQGKKITQDEWLRLRQEFSYIVVKKTPVGPYEVSTVWLGIDHGFYRGRMLIFETMIFVREPGPDGMRDSLDYQARYTTEQEAEAGHGYAVERVKTMLKGTCPDCFGKWHGPGHACAKDEKR